jgi:uncharacterized membrane protein
MQMNQSREHAALSTGDEKMSNNVDIIDQSTVISDAELEMVSGSGKWGAAIGGVVGGIVGAVVGTFVVPAVGAGIGAGIGAAAGASAGDDIGNQISSL